MLRILPDMQEDPADDDGVVEEGHDPAFAKAVRAEQHIHLGVVTLPALTVDDEKADGNEVLVTDSLEVGMPQLGAGQGVEDG